MHKASHIAFVIFIRPEDIEILQSRDTRQKSFPLGIAVKQVLGISVHIQRPQRGKRKGLVQTRARVLHRWPLKKRKETARHGREKMRQRLGVLVVIANQVCRIRFGC